MNGPNTRVVFLSDLQHLGGAGIAMSRLARGLADHNVQVMSLFNNSDSARVLSGEPVTWNSRYVGPPRSLEIVVNAVRHVSAGFARRVAHEYSAMALRTVLRDAKFDILHVHAIHNSYWDHATLAAFDPTLPIVWTFHDYWGFSAESYRIVSDDGTTLRIKPDGTDEAKALERRRDYFRSRRRCRLVANSTDTARRAREHLDLDVDVIHCGIPLDIFAPIDMRIARNALRIPEDAFVLGFIADNRADPIKGYDILQHALSTVGTDGMWAIAVGHGQPGDTMIGRVRMRMLGHVSNPRLLAIAYSAADVFVVPSRAEALGMVCMESIACATPVIGSNIGGIPDVVQEGATGWLFPTGDVRALAARLDVIGRDRASASRLRTTCRATATASWGLSLQASRYQTLYRELLQPTSQDDKLEPASPSRVLGLP